MSYLLGFTSRGCIRRCPFCVVPVKEVGIRSVSSVPELLRPDRGADHLLVLLDNNFLANPDREARMNEIERLRLTVNFCQGLDIRLVDRDVAARLAGLRTSNVRRTKPSIYFAFDHPSLEPAVRHGVGVLAQAGIAPWRLMFYMLCGFDTTFEEDMDRFRIVHGLGVDPYVMVFDGSGTPQLREDLQDRTLGAVSPSRQSDPSVSPIRRLAGAVQYCPSHGAPDEGGPKVTFSTAAGTGRTGSIAQRTEPAVKADKARLSRAEALKRVEKALAEIEFGTIEVQVEGGVPIWVLKHVRERAG